MIEDLLNNENVIYSSLFEEAKDYMYVDRFTQQIKRKVVAIQTPLDVIKEKRLVYSLY